MGTSMGTIFALGGVGGQPHFQLSELSVAPDVANFAVACWFHILDALLASIAFAVIYWVAHHCAAVATGESGPDFFIQVNSFKLLFFSIFLDIIDAWSSHGAVNHKGHHHQSNDKLHLELKGIFSLYKTKDL